MPALGGDQGLHQSEVGDHGGLIDVVGDLLGSALGSDVLGTSELRSPTLTREVEQIAGDQRDGPTRALLPWRIGS